MENNKLVSPEEAHYTVYKLTDPEGKVYIGCTGRAVKDRWDSGWGYFRHQPFWEAVTRYGWRAIRKDILCEKLTKEGAEKLEKWFVDYYASTDSSRRYNVFTGGNRRGAHPSAETLVKMREAKYRLCTENEEYNRANQKRAKEYYKAHPERRAEVAGRMRDYLLSPEGRKFVLCSSSPKPVLCVETGVIYPSARAAEREIGLCGVHKACNGSQKICGGYHWRHLQEETA